jgi:hypothetical protein
MDKKPNMESVEAARTTWRAYLARLRMDRAGAILRAEQTQRIDREIANYETLIDELNVAIERAGDLYPARAVARRELKTLRWKLAKLEKSPSSEAARTRHDDAVELRALVAATRARLADM